MKRVTVVAILAACATVAVTAQPPEGLVKNPRFTGRSADAKSPAHYALTGDAAWSYCGFGNEASDWGVALRSSKQAGSVSQDVTGFDGGAPGGAGSLGKWFRFSIRGMAEKNFAVGEGGLYLKVDFFSNKGTNPLDGVTKAIDAQVAHYHKELAANGDGKKDGGAIWKTFEFEFRLPFAEIDMLRLTTGMRGGSATTEKESAFFVTQFELVPIPPPADAPKLIKTAKGYAPSIKNLISLGGRWYYDPEPGMTAKPAKLIVNSANANRLYYMDGKLTTPFSENTTAWLRKGYMDTSGKVVEKERFVPDNVVVEFSDDKTMLVHARGLPNHPTGQFPGRWGPGGWDPHYIQEHDATYRIPLDPKPNPKAVAMDEHNSNQGLPMGAIGIAVNGVVFFNPFDAGSEDASDVMDRCCGHPAPGNLYHYHKYPVCVKSPFVDEGEEHSPLIGWAFDGYPVYGPYESKRLMAKDDTDHALNGFNMHFDEERGWHYHVTPGKFPYIIGGFYGEVDRRNGRRGPRPRRGEE
jgi:YHYH protein